MSTDNLGAIRKQVEFYFSDSNYRKDTFLKAAAEADPEGFIPIAVLLTFNKMKILNATVSSIATAMEESGDVTLSADKLKIKRSHPLPEDDTSKPRTVYLKGYPTEDEDVTIESITEQFSIYGKINMVKLRKDPETRKFKGSCFIEFETEDIAKKVVVEANDGGKMNVSYKNVPLLCIMPYLEWIKRKDEKYHKRKEKQNESKSSATDIIISEQTKTVEYTPGLILKLENFDETTTLEQFKNFFGTYGVIKYVDYTPGDKIALVRCADETTIHSIKTALSAGLSMTPGGPILKYEIMVGAEESDYWKKIVARSDDKKRFRERGRGRGRGGGRGGGGGRKKSRNH